MTELAGYLHAEADPDSNILRSWVWKMCFALQRHPTARMSRSLSIR